MRVRLGDITCNGARDDDGVLWRCRTLSGWGSPASTATTIRRPRDHGGWASKGYLAPRVLTMGGVMEAPSVAVARAAVDRLCTAAALDEVMLTVTEDIARQCHVIRDGEVLVTWVTDRLAQWSLQLLAQDPRRYATSADSASTGLPAATGGLSWPATRGALNGNSTFGTDVLGWTAAGCTIEWSAPGSCYVVPDGVSATGGITADAVDVAGTEWYQVSFGVFVTDDIRLSIDVDWYDAGDTLLSTSSVRTKLVSAGTTWEPAGWVQAPSGATQAAVAVRHSGTPATSATYWADNVRIGRMSGGLSWPATWDATVVSGRVSVTNAGNVATPALIRIDGPVTGPRVTLVGGGTLDFGSLVLADNQWLSIDTGARSVLINDQVSRAGALVKREWFDLSPGDSELAFSAADTSDDALMTVTCYSAWM